MERFRYDRSSKWLIEHHGNMILFGEEQAMIDSPILNDLIARKETERSHRMILALLEDRLGPIPNEVVQRLQRVTEEDRLTELVKVAGRCPDVETFAQQLPQ